MRSALLLFFSFFVFCSTRAAVNNPETVHFNTENPTGKLRFTTVVDGITREYYVHIPSSYTGNIAVPMVFMLHGTSGDGEKFYDSKGWKELADEENFIAVFPSSMRYKINDFDEGFKTTTKWNTTPDTNWEFQPGEKGQDDIKFLRKVIVEIQGKFNIDASRIYLNGFSNGGQMAAKCSIEMSDVLAAVAENASSFFLDTIYIPKRKLPVLFQVGNRDYGPGNTGPSIPMGYLDTLIRTENLTHLGGKFNRVAQSHINNFNLYPEFVISGDSNIAVTATFQPRTPGPGTGYEFHFILVKNLGHIYPNGNNHILDAPRVHWEWMKNYRLETTSDSLRYQLTVESGYGSGFYEKGDTVHIWAEHPTNSRTFNAWSGDYAFTEDRDNWHTTLVMPGRDAIVSAEYIVLPANLEYKKYLIPGALSTKTVYAYFPPKDKIKGVVWFFQGGSGRGYGWVTNTDQRLFLDMMVANNYGVITMDAEDVTQQMDLNNSGDLEYDYRPDTLLNPDILNVKLVRQYFVDQGAFYENSHQVSCGFSSGAGFAEILAAVLQWRASVSHNTPGIDVVADISQVPHYQNNSLNDNGPNVGPTGNINAYNNYLKYQTRDVCTYWILQKPQPLHPERFARIEGVTVTQSRAIFNFLKQANLLDEKNYLAVPPSFIENQYENNPANYPLLQVFPQTVVENIFTQLKVIYTFHTFRADYNGTALRFIDRLCETFEGYTLEVEKGYGGGTIEEGKTVHIWAEEKEGMVFSHWSGDTEYLESSLEYHTTVTMPAENVRVDANYTLLLPDMKFETLTLKGAERNKKVYTYFPPKDKIKGVVWMFHGTNGNAFAWVNEIENRQLSNRLMAAEYGIVAITSEESEFEIDFNNDGNYRWSYGIDSNLIDIANIRAVRDALLAGGKYNATTPHIALGFSAGGAFTEFVANVLRWKAAVNHNTSGSSLLSENSIIPYYHCISENDNHPDVGAAGNQEALVNYQHYLDRDACVVFEVFLQMPLYPERFDRSPLITESLSKAIFNEIKANNGLDENNYLKGLYDDLEQVVLNNITDFPVIASLTVPQRNHVKDQIQTTIAEHHFKADFNGRTVEFIQSVCYTTKTEDFSDQVSEHVLITPNPAMDVITVHVNGPFEIYSATGNLINICTDQIQDISDYATGVYIVKTEKGFARFVKM